VSRAWAVCLAVLIGLALNPTHSASASGGYRLADEPVNLGITGVSPHVEKTPTGDRVWRSDGPSGTVVSICNEAGVCTSENFSVSGGPINDFTIAQTPSGLRAYFKRIDPGAGLQSVYSAPCLTADCLSIGPATLASPGMQVPMAMRAWGVPDAVRLPDGRIRIYIVESPVEGRCTEKIATYISSDGISFTKEPGWRLEGGFVDTEILRAQDGDWLMILADIGCTSSRNQKLFTSNSKDGLTWSTPQALTGSGESRLDPTGYEIAPNTYRIYFSAGDPSRFTIKRATLRVQSGGSSTITPVAKTGRLTCVKGKTVKKVKAAKCPKGFAQSSS
jgi:hypothetical protein